MRSVLTALFLFFAAQTQVWAGAWLQEQESGFSAVTTTARKGDPYSLLENAIYVEYGLKPRITIGLDLNQKPGLSGHALVFARIPLGQATRRNRFAFEIALGAYHWQGDWNPMSKSTLSFGHSFALGERAGWLSVDAAVEHRKDAPALFYKLDATTGLSGFNRFNPILQVETTRTSGLPLMWAITPGVIIETKKAQWLVGIERKSVTTKTLGLKLSLWRRF